MLPPVLAPPPAQRLGEVRADLCDNLSSREGGSPPPQLLRGRELHDIAEAKMQQLSSIVGKTASESKNISTKLFDQLLYDLSQTTTLYALAQTTIKRRNCDLQLRLLHGYRPFIVLASSARRHSARAFNQSASSGGSERCTLPLTYMPMWPTGKERTV